ncbi:hypothetical protein [Rossellomorea aquimaris]|uniref:hypothetical protein n=1 Tax=Rossellomorea aquimaris TaxID=189382 RepID=UPI001CFCD874|nr:hypothetical protein [Rossellomorea aquimaris]
MSRWSNFNQWLFEWDRFFYLYVWILLNAMYEGVVPLGSVLPGERKYIQSIEEWEKNVYGGVYRFMPLSDFICRDHFYLMGMSVIKKCNDSGIIQPDSGRSSCGEKHVNRVRREPANRLKILEKE